MTLPCCQAENQPGENVGMGDGAALPQRVQESPLGEDEKAAAWRIVGGQVFLRRKLCARGPT